MGREEIISDIVLTDVEHLTDVQIKFLKVFDAVLGNISLACQQANVGRSTYYLWMRENPAFKINVENIKEGMIDFVESKLMQEIQKSNTTAIIFFLKTQGKDRGYVERTENDVNVNKFEELMKSLPDDDNEEG